MRRLEHFQRDVDFSVKDRDYMELDKYIPKSFDSLKLLEKISIHNAIPIAEHLITYLHESQLPDHKYIAINQLLNEFRDKYNLNVTNKNKNKIYDTLINYIYSYSHLIGHKIPSYNQTNTFKPFTDNPELTLPYIIGINQTIYRFTQNISSRTPIQLDTFLIGPNQPNISQLHLDLLPDAKIYAQSNTQSREEKSMNTIDQIKSLLYDTLVHAQPGERYIMIIIRRNINNLNNDIIYILKCNALLPAYFITDYSELIFLLNAKQTQKTIQNALKCTDNSENIFGLHYHLHSNDINKIYLSYGQFKQRMITTENMLSKLMVLFNTYNISDRIRNEFMINYRILRDIKYKYGKYFFGIEFDIKQPTELPQDDSVLPVLQLERNDELLIRFVAFEPTNVPKEIISYAPTIQPTLIPFTFHNATFTELVTYDNYNALQISQVNVDEKYNEINELKSNVNDEIDDTNSDDDNDNNDEYNRELQTMIRQFNQMNAEIHNLEVEALNMSEMKEMDEIDNVIEEAENMEANVNEIYNNVDALNGGNQQ